MRFSILPLAAVVLSGLAGCPNPTQKALLKAQKALEECDLREAHVQFDEAYELSGDDVDAALGFALTDMVFLAEDPNITHALVALGAEGPIDVEAVLYGEDALLARLEGHDDCDAMESFLEDTLPWAPLRDDDIAPLSLIDEDLTIDQVLDDLKKIDGRLARASQAFESAAAHLEEPYVLEVEGDCGGGLGEIGLQPPELLGAAATLETLRAVIQIGDGYDWDMTIHDLASEDDPLIVDTCNAHLGRLVDPAAVEQGGATLLRALDLADRALAATQDAGPVGNNAFAWSLLDPQMVAEIREFGDAARSSLEQDTIETIPYWTPELGANLGGLFSSPPDVGTLDGPLFRLESGQYLDINTKRLEALFEGYFDRDIFRSDNDETIDVEWDQDLEEVLNPGGRYDDLYCD